MAIHHSLGFLLLAIFGVLGQGLVLIRDEDNSFINKTIVAGYTGGSYIHPSTGISGMISDLTSATLPGYDWSIIIKPTSVFKSNTSVAPDVTTSWTPITMVGTTTEVVVNKPSTITETIVIVSTVESTVTRTAKYASWTTTFTNAIIVDFSTETIYTSTWLAPPEETSYTLTRTTTSVSEAMVVPTDVTYTFTSLPLAPTSAIVTRPLLTLTEGNLSWGESFGNTTTSLGFQIGAGASARGNSSTAGGIDTSETRSRISQSPEPSGNKTAGAFTGDVAASDSAEAYPTSMTASVSTRWATKSNTSLNEEPTTMAETLSVHWATKTNDLLDIQPISSMTETFLTYRANKSNTLLGAKPTTTAISTHWATKSGILLNTEPNKIFASHWAMKINPSLREQEVSSLSSDTKYPTATVVSVSTQRASKDDTSLGGPTVLSAGTSYRYTNAPSISEGGFTLADVTSVTTSSSPDGAASTAATSDSTRPLGNHTSGGTMTAALVPAASTVPSTTPTTTDLALVTITMSFEDNSTTATPSASGSSGPSMMAMPTTGSGGASSKAISTVLLVVVSGILLVTT